MFRWGLLGGTFDRFHDGHAYLIEQALKKCQYLEIWITHDSVAASKDPMCWPLERRRSEIQSSIGDDSLDRVFFGILNDDIGPAGNHTDADVIFCTSETRDGCDEINKIRSKNGLIPLNVVEIDHIISGSGTILSSSRIRKGEMDRSGVAYVPEKTINTTWKITDDVQLMLKKPFGKLFSGTESDPSIALKKALKEAQGHQKIIAVGDVTTWGLVELGIIPSIAIIDGMTKRSPWARTSEIKDSIFDRVLSAENLAGEVSSDLFQSCKKAVEFSINGASVLIRVTGEEDLAPIPMHLLSPLGSMVIYGQPGEGVVTQVVDLDTKDNCRRILNAMKAV